MTDQKKSQLVPAGVALILIGMFLPQQAEKFLPSRSMGTALTIDGLRLCFFIGITMVIIGWLRNRKATRT